MSCANNSDLIRSKMMCLLRLELRHLKQIIFSVVFIALSGCATIEQAAHLYSNKSLSPSTFQYHDGGSSIYYAFTVGNASQPDTAIFLYGATGCPSLKAPMPQFLDGLAVNARVFALNKRFVSDHSFGLLDCGREFNLANNPGQWVADYSEFVEAQLQLNSPRFKNVVLIGVSEAAWPTARVAKLVPEVTHLVLIGSGGNTMRQDLETLKRKGAIDFDVDSGWKRIRSDPASIEKYWYGNTYRWWAEVLDFDPMPDLLALNIPIIVGMGEEDQSVPVESAYILQQKFKEAGKNNLTLKIYPKSGHGLNGNGISDRVAFFATLSQILAPLPK